MSLGGYKFVGYKFVLPDNYDGTDDSQVIAQILRFHKMKLTAFMESCSLSGANWHFSETNGDASFGSYGNVIYKLDTSGFNYASFFQYGNENAYYCMLSLSDASTSSSEDVALALDNYYWFWPSTSSTYCTSIVYSMDAVSLTPFNISNMFDPNYANKRLMFRGNTTWGVSTGTQTVKKVIPPSGSKFGFATKNKNILTFSGTTTLYFKVSSIDSLTLSNPDDVSNMFSVNLYIGRGTSNPSQNSQFIDYSGGPTQYFQVNKSNGSLYEYHTYNSSGISSKVSIPIISKAISIGVGSKMPFESIVISAGYERTQATAGFISQNITSKGVIDIDLLAMNLIYETNVQSSTIIPGTTYANGNYLCLYNILTQYRNCNGIIYCGWDASNSDINEDSTWQVYNG